MASFGDYALAILSGGLPAAVDYGSSVPGNAQGDTGALSQRSASSQAAGEKRAPTGTFRDTTPGLAVPGFTTAEKIGLGVGAVAVLGLILALVLKR